MFASRFARNAAKSFRLGSAPVLRRGLAVGSALSLAVGAVFAQQHLKRSQEGDQQPSFVAEALKAVLPVANAEAAKTPTQSAVYSGGKNHAGYLWLRLSDQADVAKVAALVAKVPELAASLAPPNEKGEVDEDEEVLVSVAFGPATAAKLGLKAPKDFAYQTRSGPVGDMPATGGDVFIHIKSNTQSNVFDLAQQIHQLIPGAWAKSFEDRYGFVYRRGRDLSGFIDGTENPASEDDRYDAAVIPQTGGSFVLTQRWVHHRNTNEVHEVKAQEQFVGRSKDNSVALNPLPPTSHVARMTGHDASGKKMNIVRQSMPYGDLRGESGLFFIAYFKDPAVINYMLDRMTGTGTATDKKHDDIMRFSRCVDGNVWYVPSPAELAALKK